VLNYLSVKNYALIDSVEISFTDGFSIITGETGAGKSILLGALSLILGQRADINVLKNKELKCIIEGSFSIKGYALEDFFKQNEIDYDDEAILRREINSAGKSRAFINDTPVNLSALQELSTKLIDIHSQHQNLDLNESVFQLNVIDTFAGNTELKKQYKTVYQDFTKLKRQLSQLKESAGRSRDDFEYFQFQFDELEKAKLISDEQELLEEEQKALSHTEDIQRNLSTIFNLISENPESVIASLNESVKAAGLVIQYMPKLTELSQRLESTYIEIKDIAAEIEMYAGQVQFDPERAEFVNDRLNLIYTLQKKHKVSTIEELIQIKNDFYQKINDIESFDERLKEAQAAYDKKFKELESVAGKLSKNRLASFSSIEKYVTEQLNSLGMPNAIFKIAAEKLEEFGPNGIDKINFLFSANKNGEPQNIAKVASGGEISRLMLSIKSLLSKSSGLPTIIFDEIDTGVSGEIADKMGGIMLQMSDNMQVISITHLPQVAAKGTTHYLVYKDEFAEFTSTKIKKLTEDERLKEIAKMLSGENLSQQALENARVLLQK